MELDLSLGIYTIYIRNDIIVDGILVISVGNW